MPSRGLVVLLAIVVSGCTPASEPASANTSPANPAPANASPAHPALMSVPEGRSEPIATREQRAGTALGDLDAIAARGFLRVLVAPSEIHFRTVDGRHRGKAVEIGVDLADDIARVSGKPVNAVFIETGEEQLIPALLGGRGDVAANLLLTFARDEQVAFAPPIVAHIRELIVTPAGKPLVSLEDVGGRVIHVRKNSEHHASLLRLNEQLIKIDRPPARLVVDGAVETDEELLRRVNDGRVPAAIAYSYIYRVMRPQLPRVAANDDIAVSQDGQVSWVTRKDAVKLVGLMKDYFTSRHFGFES